MNSKKEKIEAIIRALKGDLTALNKAGLPTWRLYYFNTTTGSYFTPEGEPVVKEDIDRDEREIKRAHPESKVIIYKTM